MKGFQVLVWVHRVLAVYCLGMIPICWMAVGQGEATVIFAGITTVALIAKMCEKPTTLVVGWIAL